MQEFPPEIAAHLAARLPMHALVLLWLTARSRSTGAAGRIGFWTGEDHRSFAIRGEARSYYGAGNLLVVDPIRRETGLKLSQITPRGAAGGARR